MNKPTLAVLFGGQSSEHKISLQSASAVIRAINKDKYDVVMLGIDPAGQWFRFRGDADQIADGTWRGCGCTPAWISPSREVHGLIEWDGGVGRTTRLDAAFPVLHGKNGEDGTVQGLLELAGIPIVGCSTAASAVCMDKELAHTVAAKAGIKVPRGTALRSRKELECAAEKTARVSFPVFVKPARAGSSFGVACIKKPEDLRPAVETAFLYDSKVIVEEKVEGFEVGCAIMGSGDDLTIGAVDEIEIQGDLFDFTEKYTAKTSKVHVPARVSAQRAEQIKSTAARIYRALGCSGFARIDMFVTPLGKIIFNEANTIPGFTEHSRFPGMMEHAGLSFGTIIETLIETAVTQ